MFFGRNNLLKNIINNFQKLFAEFGLPYFLIVFLPVNGFLLSDDEPVFLQELVFAEFPQFIFLS